MPAAMSDGWWALAVILDRAIRSAYARGKKRYAEFLSRKNRNTPDTKASAACPDGNAL
jgi:hypothetical protein